MKGKYQMTGFEYKCRRCNEVFIGGFCVEQDPKTVVKNKLESTPPYANLDGSVAYKAHECKDGGSGVADWIGCRPNAET